MNNTATVLAFDFGASSGRAIRAVYDGQNLTYEEIHRFENVPIEKDGHLCWDVETLLKEIHTAIQKAGTFDSLGFDTWGVDFGLLDTDGHLLANPVHYRDARTGLRAQHCVHQPDAGPPHRAVEQRSAGRLRLAGKPLRTHCFQRHSDRYTCKRCENHCGGRA